MHYADLHLHSTASDGCLTPTELVAKAKELNIQVIALTDHDTTDGIKEALAAGRTYSVRVIPGIELSTELDDREIHILGYKINRNSPALQKMLNRLKQARIQRLQDITKLLRENGFDITWQEVLAVAGSTSSLGRPHVARVMVSKGYASSVKAVFAEWIGQGCPCYVKRFKLTPQDGIDIIHAAGGMAFLAHPGLLLQGLTVANSLLPYGLDGVEVFHSMHSDDQIQEILAFARSEELSISGGSDCHGIGELKMGTVKISTDIMAGWLKD